MRTNNNIPYYLIAAGLFVLLKFCYTFAENTDLIFLLKPVNKLVGFLTGSNAVYHPDTGYFHEHLGIIIDKSCSGFNFWVLSFLLFTFLTLKIFDVPLQKILGIPMALLGAYLLTIFVNASRIFVSIITYSYTKNVFQNQQHILHEAIGIITNLTFLILAYVLVEKLLIRLRGHAKFV